MRVSDNNYFTILVLILNAKLGYIENMHSIKPLMVTSAITKELSPSKALNSASRPSDEIKELVPGDTESVIIILLVMCG